MHYWVIVHSVSSQFIVLSFSFLCFYILLWLLYVLLVYYFSFVFVWALLPDSKKFVAMYV